MLEVTHWVAVHVYPLIDIYLNLLIGFVFMNLSTRLLSRKVVISSILMCTYYTVLTSGDLTRNEVALALIPMYLLMYFIFLSGQRKWFWMGYISSSLFALFSEMFFAIFMKLSFSIEILSLLTDPTISWLTIFVLLMKITFIWSVRYYRLTFFRNHQHHETKERSVWFLYTAAAGSSVNFGLYLLMDMRSNTSMVVLMSGFIVAVTLLFFLYILYQKKEENDRLMLVQQEQLDQVSVLFSTFRSERHDFVNHVQTLYGFLQANMYDNAQSYVKTLVGEIKLLNEVIVHDNPALSALLQVKMAECLRDGIDLNLQLECNLSMIDWKLTEMNVLIGNIVNNSREAIVFASPKGNGGSPEIRIASEMLANGTVNLSIWNNGPVIPSEQLERIMEAGFSTKSKQRGQGLASVQVILTRLGATLQVTSDESNGTLFWIEIPVLHGKDQMGSHNATKADVHGLKKVV